MICLPFDKRKTSKTCLQFGWCVHSLCRKRPLFMPDKFAWVRRSYVNYQEAMEWVWL